MSERGSYRDEAESIERKEKEGEKEKEVKKKRWK